MVLCIYGGIGTFFGIVFIKETQQNNKIVIDSKAVTDNTITVDCSETIDSTITKVTETEKNNYIRDQLHKSQYYHYHNNRFDYGISYPSCFIQQEESTNGDGCRFYMNEKIYLSVYASYNALNETLADRFYERNDTTTYSSLKSNWFVVSGYTNDKIIFYQKTVLKNDIFITAILYYPPEYQNEFQEITQYIFSKFPN